MKLTFVADLRMPNAWYRIVGPMQAMARRGHTVHAAMDNQGKALPERVAGCDLLMVYRAFDQGALDVIRAARSHGAAVVWDNDDDITVVPGGGAAARQMRGMAGEARRRDLRRVVEAADLVTTPSPVLAERLREFGAQEIRVVENYVRDDVVARRRSSNGRLVVGWLAGGEHHIDVSQIPISEACEALLDARPHVEVMTIGARLRTKHPRYRNVRDIPLFDLTERMAEFDIGIAPIADTAFNRCRSDIKLKEYAVLGIPWLASPVGPYVGHGEKEGGRLVPDDAWHDELDRLIVDRRGRMKLAKRAVRWGNKQRVGDHAEEWEEALMAALENVRTSVR